MTEASSRMRTPCPVCDANAYVRTSRALSNRVREQYLHCSNTRCGCIFKVLAEVSTIIGPSLLPESEQSKESRNLLPAAK